MNGIFSTKWQKCQKWIWFWLVLQKFVATFDLNRSSIPQQHKGHRDGTKLLACMPSSCKGKLGLWTVSLHMFLPPSPCERVSESRNVCIAENSQCPLQVHVDLSFVNKMWIKNSLSPPSRTAVLLWLRKRLASVTVTWDLGKEKSQVFQSYVPWQFIVRKKVVTMACSSSLLTVQVRFLPCWFLSYLEQITVLLSTGHNTTQGKSNPVRSMDNLRQEKQFVVDSQRKVLCNNISMIVFLFG